MSLRPGGPPPPGPGAFADNPIYLLLYAEIKLNPHFCLALVDELIVVFRPGLPPERPSYGVDKCRLAVAVITADAGGMYTVEIERRYTVPVAHEVVYCQLYGDHAFNSQPQISLAHFNTVGRFFIYS